MHHPCPHAMLLPISSIEWHLTEWKYEKIFLHRIPLKFKSIQINVNHVQKLIWKWTFFFLNKQIFFFSIVTYLCIQLRTLWKSFFHYMTFCGQCWVVLSIVFSGFHGLKRFEKNKKVFLFHLVSLMMAIYILIFI